MDKKRQLSNIKKKLVLFEFEQIHGLLSDVIQEAIEYIDCKEITISEKIFIIQKLKHKYHRFVKDNDILPAKQSKLFS